MVPQITFDLRGETSFVLNWSDTINPEVDCIITLMSCDNDFTAKAELICHLSSPAHALICI